MRKIAIFYTNRAEEGLLKPVMKRIEDSSMFQLIEVDASKFFCSLNVKDYGKYYEFVYQLLRKEKPDLALCSFDRYEMIFPALAAYFLRIPIAQIHAGDKSLEGTWDDMNRHVISLYADIHFCNGAPSYLRIIRLLETVGRSTKHVYEVGSTAFDDLEIDETPCPNEPYDLLLYNPPTKKPEVMLKELLDITDLIDKPVVWMEPNGDPGSEDITHFILDLKAHPPFPLNFISSLPRNQFLGLIKNASRFIGNSSSLFYEAPYFLKPEQIIHIGVRNKGREPIEIRTGASDRIVRILEKIDLETFNR